MPYTGPASAIQVNAHMALIFNGQQLHVLTSLLDDESMKMRRRLLSGRQGIRLLRKAPDRLIHFMA